MARLSDPHDVDVEHKRMLAGDQGLRANLERT